MAGKQQEERDYSAAIFVTRALAVGSVLLSQQFMLVTLSLQIHNSCIIIPLEAT
jgi:hypothetical protein